MSDTQTSSLASLAGEAYAQFTTMQRGDETITVLRDDCADWVQELAYAAHGEFLPDDWRYQSIASALEAINDAGAIHAAGSDDLDDLAHEWADGNVDVYTHARLQWLASNLNRPSYVDEAMEEGLIGADSLEAERIGVGQYVESLEVFEMVRTALQDRLEELDES